MRKFEAIRTEIKTLSDLQRVLKPQRKESYKGERTPGNVDKNKYELRHLFEAYAILRGVERQKVTKPSNYNGLIIDEKKIEQIINKYKPTEEVV